MTVSNPEYAIELELALLAGGGRTADVSSIEGEVFALFDRWAPSLLRYVASFGLSAEECEDIVQDVLLTLHSVRATYDQARPVLPWVLGIAANRVAEAKRRAARLCARELLVDTPPDILTCADASSGAQSYGDVEALHHAIAKLPHGQKIAVRLVKLREMTFGEAAALSGTSPAALKAAVYRGMAALRDRLEDAHA